MANTLIERALAYKSKAVRRSVTEDEMELGIAWAQGTLRSSQVAVALGHPVCGPTTYTRLAMFLQAAVQSGKLAVPHA